MPAGPAGALRLVPSTGVELDDRYAADTWRAEQLGVPATRGRATVSFTGIGPAWLREGAKHWARQRLAAGHAFNTICAGAGAFKRFSIFLADCASPVGRPERHRSATDGTLLGLARAAAAGRCDQGTVAGVPARLPRGEPPLRLGARYPCRRGDLPR